ncbi:hypothetical protein FJT64_024018 [Amphibalanus amphitrite]|uniref:Uncharacterized protein n=1 Tax=Amphibalanus amphitrite TaxID=1232801 RepID=A0A6A4WN66_AMPAM|nr:hypothetical protein FJT64_024018 [Amphibalanus amphitrite]
MSALVLPADLPRDTLLLPAEKWQSIRGHLTGQQERQQRRQQEQEHELRRRAVSAHIRRDWPRDGQACACLTARPHLDV